MLDILITNGTVIDGSGMSAKPGAIGIKHGKLVAATETEEAARVIDAAGRIVCRALLMRIRMVTGCWGRRTGDCSKHRRALDCSRKATTQTC